MEKSHSCAAQTPSLLPWFSHCAIRFAGAFPQATKKATAMTAGTINLIINCFLHLIKTLNEEGCLIVDQLIQKNIILYKYILSKFSYKKKTALYVFAHQFNSCFCNPPITTRCIYAHSEFETAFLIPFGASYLYNVRVLT